MYNKWLISLYIFCCVKIAYAQTNIDTIYVQGNVSSLATGELIEASVSYESLPYGNDAGVIEGAQYRFPLLNNNRYAIVVTVPGYVLAKYIIEPSEADERRLVTKNIVLHPLESVLSVSHDTHTVGKSMIIKTLLINEKTFEIAEESFPELDSLVSMLKHNSSMIIAIEGHMDAQDVQEHGANFSLRRANAVRHYLMKEGIEKKRIKTKNMGVTYPMIHEDEREVRRLNRRVEVRVLENN